MQNFQPRGAIRSLDGCIAQFVQHVGNQHPYGWLIIDDQHCFAGFGPWHLDAVNLDLFVACFAVIPGKIKADGRAGAHLRVDPHLAA